MAHLEAVDIVAQQPKNNQNHEKIGINFTDIGENGIVRRPGMYLIYAFRYRKRLWPVRNSTYRSTEHQVDQQRRDIWSKEDQPSDAHGCVQANQRGTSHVQIRHRILCGHITT